MARRVSERSFSGADGGAETDSEQADLRRERQELREDPVAEEADRAGIYVARRLKADLAQQVAVQLAAHDALGAHARDELGLSEMTAARPLQAALGSAAAFAVGAVEPLAIAMAAPLSWIAPVVATASLLLLMVLGAGGAKIGGGAWSRAPQGAPPRR